MSTGDRPLTELEQSKVEEWKLQVAKYEEQQALIEKKYQQLDESRKIFRSTLQFLTNEGLIRFHDIPTPRNSSSVIDPPDVMISRKCSTLRFVLTSKGFMHLNRKLDGGKIVKNMTLYEAIKRNLKEQGIQGGASFAAQSLVALAIS